ncbi:MAG: hypothetical protein FJ196_00765 [Gammaproteobacteria bacterium]|nr:hypothetical protein [Gammaproteobacteria bacterium]
MYSLMFLAFAIAQTALFVWAVRLWRETRAKPLVVILVPQFFLIWDNLRVASGIVIGFGGPLYWMTWPAFWVHWLSGCWLIIASGSILRLAGFEFVQNRAAMGVFCLATVALMLHELPLFWTKEIYPVCEYDLIRYSGSVTEANRCSPDQALVKGEFPIAPVVTCFVVIGTGIALWIRRGFPWMAIGGIVMLLTAAVPILNRHRLDNLGEIFIEGGSILAVWFLIRKAGVKVQQDRVPQNPVAHRAPTAN